MVLHLPTTPIIPLLLISLIRLVLISITSFSISVFQSIIRDYSFLWVFSIRTMSSPDRKLFSFVIISVVYFCWFCFELGRYFQSVWSYYNKWQWTQAVFCINHFFNSNFSELFLLIRVFSFIFWYVDTFNYLNYLVPHILFLHAFKCYSEVHEGYEWCFFLQWTFSWF